jgi:hypothetical protein
MDSVCVLGEEDINKFFLRRAPVSVTPKSWTEALEKPHMGNKQIRNLLYSVHLHVDSENIYETLWYYIKIWKKEKSKRKITMNDRTKPKITLKYD